MGNKKISKKINSPELYREINKFSSQPRRLDTIYPQRCRLFSLTTKTNKTMATKVTILGEQPIEQEKKKIEFLIRINSFSGNSETTSIRPNAWANIELIKPKESQSGYDVMFAYDSDRTRGTIFLGHFNDGIV